jgi:hypothetical protein
LVPAVRAIERGIRLHFDLPRHRDPRQRQLLGHYLQHRGGFLCVFVLVVVVAHRARLHLSVRR